MRLTCPPGVWSLWEGREAVTLSAMDAQETIDSPRRMLESDIVPGVESLRLRLDALDGRIDHLSLRADRLAERIDRLSGRMENGFARMDTRLDALAFAILNAWQPSNPDAVLTRLEKLEQEIERLRK